MLRGSAIFQIMRAANDTHTLWVLVDRASLCFGVESIPSHAWVNEAIDAALSFSFRDLRYYSFCFQGTSTLFVSLVYYAENTVR
jgi:hypothetical protein